MRLRKVLFNVHLYVALIVGLFLSVTGLSGSLLVFRHEVDHALNPGLLTVAAPSTPHGGPPLPLQAIVDAVRAAHPGAAPQLLFPATTATATHEVTLAGSDTRVYVDPYTGQVLGARAHRRTLPGFLFSLHAELLNGERGKTVVGILGLLLLVLGITGLVLWWPGWRGIGRGLRIQWHTGWRRANYDLHRVGGVLYMPALLVSTLTGMVLVFPAFFTTLTETALGAGPHPPNVIVTPPAPDAVPLPLDRLVQAADAALPGTTTTRIALPAKPQAAVVVRKRYPSETHPNGMSFLHLDPYTAEILATVDAARATAGQRLLNWRYPLHTGLLAGWPTRIITCLSGLMPGALFVTGCLMWWTRTRARAQRRRRGTRSPAVLAADGARRAECRDLAASRPTQTRRD